MTRKKNETLLLSIRVVSRPSDRGTLIIDMKSFVKPPGSFSGEAGRRLDSILSRVEKFAKTEFDLGEKESMENENL